MRQESSRVIDLVDTHCHLDLDAYAGDRDSVLRRANDAGVTRIVNPAVDLASSKAIVSLAAQQQSWYVAVGVHPNEALSWTAGHLEKLRELADQNGVVAVGEIGLDYFRDRAPHALQREILQAQLELAAEMDLPVIIHNREASTDLMAILDDWHAGLVNSDSSLAARPGVLHSFSATAGVAEQALEAQFFIGITGPVTFRKADDLRQVVAGLPLERILVETDGPYLTPHPYRGKRNEPAYVRYTAEKIAEIHGLSLAEVALRTTANAKRLFEW